MIETIATFVSAPVGSRSTTKGAQTQRTTVAGLLGAMLSKLSPSEISALGFQYHRTPYREPARQRSAFRLLPPLFAYSTADACGISDGGTDAGLAAERVPILTKKLSPSAGDTA